MSADMCNEAGKHLQQHAIFQTADSLICENKTYTHTDQISLPPRQNTKFRNHCHKHFLEISFTVFTCVFIYTYHNLNQNIASHEVNQEEGFWAGSGGTRGNKFGELASGGNSCQCLDAYFLFPHICNTTHQEGLWVPPICHTWPQRLCLGAQRGGRLSGRSTKYGHLFVSQAVFSNFGFHNIRYI